MTTMRRALAVGALGLLATALPARADSPNPEGPFVNVLTTPKTR